MEDVESNRIKSIDRCCLATQETADSDRVCVPSTLIVRKSSTCTMSSEGAFTSYWASKAYICSTTCAFLVMVFS